MPLFHRVGCNSKQHIGRLHAPQRQVTDDRCEVGRKRDRVPQVSKQMHLGRSSGEILEPGCSGLQVTPVTGRVSQSHTHAPRRLCSNRLHQTAVTQRQVQGLGQAHAPHSSGQKAQ